MDNRLQQLETLGIDVETTLKRFCGNVNLLMSMLEVFVREDTLEKLPEAMRAKDYEAAESIAHAVKGTAANLGLASLSTRCDALVQAIRANHLCNVDDLALAALESYRTARANINALS